MYIKLLDVCSYRDFCDGISLTETLAQTNAVIKSVVLFSWPDVILVEKIQIHLSVNLGD